MCFMLRTPRWIPWFRDEGCSRERRPEIAGPERGALRWPVPRGALWDRRSRGFDASFKMCTIMAGSRKRHSRNPRGVQGIQVQGTTISLESPLVSWLAQYRDKGSVFKAHLQHTFWWGLVNRTASKRTSCEDFFGVVIRLSTLSEMLKKLCEKNLQCQDHRLLSVPCAPLHPWHLYPLL